MKLFSIRRGVDEWYVVAEDWGKAAEAWKQAIRERWTLDEHEAVPVFDSIRLVCDSYKLVLPDGEEVDK